MSDILRRIKRAVIAGNLDYSEKARLEMLADHLNESDVRESILTADRIDKTIRSTREPRKGKREYLHIIKGQNLIGEVIYTKGKLVTYGGIETYYFMVSAKAAT